MKQLLNGETHESYLCENCALKTENLNPLDEFFQGFLDLFLISQIGSEQNTTRNTDFKCSECGWTYEKFKKMSLLGCEKCYITFKNQLMPVLKNIQDANVHQGKFPKKSGSSLLQKRIIEELRAKLSKAIEKEEYEEAAKLRDEIKELERRV